MNTELGPIKTKDMATTSARSLRIQSRVYGALGLAGLTEAALLIYPKALVLLAGDLSILGVGAIANLALVFGSLMFLRYAQVFRRRAAALPHAEPSAGALT